MRSRLLLSFAVLGLAWGCSDSSSNGSLPPPFQGELQGQPGDDSEVGSEGSNGDTNDSSNPENDSASGNGNTADDGATGSSEGNAQADLDGSLDGNDNANGAADDSNDADDGDGNTEPPADGEGTDDPTAEDPAAEDPPTEDPPAEDPPNEEPVSIASPGCINGQPPTPPAGLQLSLGLPTGNADYYVRTPPGYDGQTPAQLVFGFHGRNRTHIEFRNVDASNIQTAIEPNAIVVYPKSQGGNGWNFDNEVPPNVAFFEALYDEILGSYCVDTSRVFSIGHSSGGYFSNILACRFPERLRGIGAVAGQTQECAGQVAAIVIHGETDTVVSFAGGVQSRDRYLQVNGCSNQSQPVGIASCIAYQGCNEGLPVQWCQHTEPTYQENGVFTNHGWPSFASQAIGQFLFALE